MTEPLRLEWRTPAELAENPRNWRSHPAGQVAALDGLLDDVGWAGALLYNERTGRLIDGHLRRERALARGDGKVPVLVGSWDEEQEKKILATLDPIGSMASADADALPDGVLIDVSPVAREAGIRHPVALTGPPGRSASASRPASPARTRRGDSGMSSACSGGLSGGATAGRRCDSRSTAATTTASGHPRWYG
jgi:hypothetical protein